jgi:hypothetical protein
MFWIFLTLSTGRSTCCQTLELVDVWLDTWPSSAVVLSTPALSLLSLDSIYRAHFLCSLCSFGELAVLSRLKTRHQHLFSAISAWPSRHYLPWLLCFCFPSHALPSRSNATYPPWAHLCAPAVLFPICSRVVQQCGQTISLTAWRQHRLVLSCLAYVRATDLSVICARTS